MQREKGRDRQIHHEYSGRSTTNVAADPPLKNLWPPTLHRVDIDDLTLFSRRAHGMVREALTDTRVVMINGARQTGKSTLAQAIARETPGARELFLDQAAVRAAARQDPDGVVHHDGLVLIDEIQRVPDLLLSIKHEVDSNPRPGRFLLTGSARLLGLKDLPDALPGRSETIELWPLSQGEIEQKPDGFVDSVFQNGADIEIPRPLFRRADYLTARCAEAIRKPFSARLIDGGHVSSTPTSPT